MSTTLSTALGTPNLKMVFENLTFAIFHEFSAFFHSSCKNTKSFIEDRSTGFALYLERMEIKPKYYLIC